MFATLSLLLALALTEVVCRGRERLRDGQRVLYYPAEPDPYRGVVLTPGAVHAVDGRIARINALGMRAPEVAVAEREGTTRVLCVGGSSTYGLMVSRNESTWPACLERELRAAGHRVEFLDAGVPSWTLRESQTNLELRLDALRPDVVIVCHTFNDVMANPDPEYDRASHVDDARRLWRPWVRSALVRTVLQRLEPRSRRLSAKAAKVRDAGVAAFERNLRRMVRHCQALGAHVLLLTEPSCLRPTLDRSRSDHVPALEVWYRHYATLEYAPLLEAVTRYGEVTRRVAVETGASFVDMEPLVPDIVALWGSPIHRVDAGEVVFAAQLADAIRRDGLLEARLREPQVAAH